MPTILCFEAHAADGRVWSVRHQNRWQTCHAVRVLAPVETVYRGRAARQPKAYLSCTVPVTVTGTVRQLVIRPVEL